MNTHSAQVLDFVQFRAQRRLEQRRAELAQLRQRQALLASAPSPQAAGRDRLLSPRPA